MTSRIRKALAVLVAAALLLPGAALNELGLIPPLRMDALWYGQYLEELESNVTAGLPYREALREFALGLRLFAGQTEQREIFICDDELILNVDPPVESFVRDNTAAVLEFAQQADIPTHFVLIPTASAIRQESLAPYARSQVYNQRALIEEVGAQMAGRVTVSDAYSVLFGARDQYVYYRTENNLTALGGYYIYSVLGSRLLEGTIIGSLSDYDVEYVARNYYGDLYARSPYKNITPDILSLYHYTATQRQYLVTHYRGGEAHSYRTIYPMHRLALGDAMDVYLGGLSAITDIQISNTYDHSLLIFGDKTALAYVPFLANHYASITVVDLIQLTAEDYAQINPHDYSQVLFAYGVESFMHTSHPTISLRLLDNL